MGAAVCLLLMGCASMLPQDYMVMQEALKQEAFQAQQTSVSLHVQVQVLEEQLGAARAAQARVQGELRDSERRLNVALRVAESQRDDVIKARESREQLVQATDELNRLRQRVADTDREYKRMRVLQTSIHRLTEQVAMLNTSVRDGLVHSKPSAVSTDEVVSDLLSEHIKPARILIVKSGDTLFSLAKRYAVGLAELKNTNRLANNRILVGQLLVVPEP
jgi:predicted  nucleic acid-binding Zn-ribbon protein